MAEIDHGFTTTQGAVPRTSTVLIVLVIAALIAVLGAAYQLGRGAQVARAQAEVLAVEAETRAFCTSLQLAPGSDAYRRCDNGLATIRQRLEQRLAAESAGIL